MSCIILVLNSTMIMVLENWGCYFQKKARKNNDFILKDNTVSFMQERVDPNPNSNLKPALTLTPTLTLTFNPTLTKWISRPVLGGNYFRFDPLCYPAYLLPKQRSIGRFHGHANAQRMLIAFCMHFFHQIK